MTPQNDQGGVSGNNSDDLNWLYHGAPPQPVADDIDWLYGASPRVRQDNPAPRPPSTPSAPSAPKAPSTPKPPRKHHPVRRVVTVLLVLIGLWAAFLVYAPLHAWSRVSTVDATPAEGRPPAQPGTAILMVGTDSREGLTAAQKKRLGTGDALGSRTDTMMIYYVPPSGKPALISLPRDSYLPIPGHKSNKLNAAYAFGGPALLVQTVEQATGLRIDGYLEIGFGGFVTLVDAVGGVQVCLNAPMKDAKANINLPAGCQTLDGVNALGYVRQRYSDPRGDLGRIERQREVVGKVLEKIATPATVLNPVRYWSITQALSTVIVRGDKTGLGVLMPVGLSVRSFASGQTISLTVPISNPDAHTNVGSSVLWDDKKASEMFAMLAKGDTSQLDQFR